MLKLAGTIAPLSGAALLGLCTIAPALAQPMRIAQRVPQKLPQAIPSVRRTAAKLLKGLIAEAGLEPHRPHR